MPAKGMPKVKPPVSIKSVKAPESMRSIKMVPVPKPVE
jgi:hypothetical protein